METTFVQIRDQQQQTWDTFLPGWKKWVARGNAGRQGITNYEAVAGGVCELPYRLWHLS